MQIKVVVATAQVDLPGERRARLPVASPVEKRLQTVIRHWLRHLPRPSPSLLVAELHPRVTSAFVMTHATPRNAHNRTQLPRRPFTFLQPYWATSLNAEVKSRMKNALPYALDEIDQRITDLRTQARAAGVTVLPPLLALGTSERVGSNWLSDTLRPVMPQHNEPFRQQLGALHPLSPVNPYGVEVDRVPRVLLGRLGWHALVESVVAKYAPVRHLVKETNLFFTTRSLLRLFADAPVVVLTRSPIGVASSFARSNLYHRWGYANRYR